jgi:DNA (cytosine-5)-methyltransferase 1
MKVLSLFSGVGGFDMGLENAGMQTVFQCEWDKHANSILHRHWPDVPKWDDVSTLTGKHILANAPEVDVVAWGSPCQDLSVAGKRAGLEGGRSGLFHEGIRIIKELQEESNGQYPRISIWENVVGALNSNRGADFGVILDEMAQAGALAIEWAVLDAQYFGIPQRRRRVFVIAIFDPVLANRSPSPLLPVAESLPGHLAKGKPQRQSATAKTSTSIGAEGAWWDGRDTAEALTTTSNENRMPDKQKFQAVVVGPLTTHMSSPRGTETSDSNHIVIECYTPSSFANYSEGVGTLRSNGGDLGGGSETLVAEPTMAVRRLTPLECERLMGWPDNHTLTKADGTTQADTHRYKQCGNGVASPVAQWIAKHLLNI